jgi:hypothetical protein
MQDLEERYEIKEFVKVFHPPLNRKLFTPDAKN